jgi:hypothetical protein
MLMSGPLGWDEYHAGCSSCTATSRDSAPVKKSCFEPVRLFTPAPYRSMMR